MIDEADRLLEANFEEEMKQIIKYLPKDRQTALFSATQTKKVEDLVKLSFRKDQKPIYVDVDEGRTMVTNEGLQQGYCIVPSAKRFLLLYSFLTKNLSKKVMVFFSSCNSVKFHSELLKYVNVDCFDIHGKQKQQKRTTTFFDFCKAEKGILLCTDVAARGLDIPAVDWILQFDPPDEPKEYIHRVWSNSSRGTFYHAFQTEHLTVIHYLICSNLSILPQQIQNFGEPFSWSYLKVRLWLKLKLEYKRNYKLRMRSLPRYNDLCSFFLVIHEGEAALNERMQEYKRQVDRESRWFLQKRLVVFVLSCKLHFSYF